MAEYSNLTVAQLKDELRNRNLTVGGRKAELIERLVGSDDQPGVTVNTSACVATSCWFFQNIDKKLIVLACAAWDR